MSLTESSPDVLRFSKLAEEFCNLIENLDGDSGRTCEKLLLSMAELYAAALLLPESEDFEINEDFRLSHENWKIIFMKMGSMLKVHSMYWTVSDKQSLPDAPPTLEMGNLDDDLADVYRDIKSGLSAWKSSSKNRYNDAMYHWRDSVNFAHWSRHAVDAIGALHEIVFYTKETRDGHNPVRHE